MDRLTAMRVFVAVAEERGFAPAARRIGLSTSAVSRHVAELEAHLGAQLLRRTTRRLDLTEAGARYLPRAETLLCDLDALEGEVSNLSGAPKGLLRVTSAPQFGEQFLAPVAAAFARAYPEVRLEMEFSERMIDLIAEGYDAALRSGPLKNLSLKARRLAEPDYVVCASPDYLRRAGTPDHPDQLRQHQCIHWCWTTAPPSWRFWDRDDPKKEIEVPISGRFAVGSAIGQREGALAGLGVALFMPSVVEHDLQNGRLVRILADYPLQRSSVSLVWPPLDPEPPKLRVFIDFLVQALHKSGGAAEVGDRTP